MTAKKKLARKARLLGLTIKPTTTGGSLYVDQVIHFDPRVSPDLIRKNGFTPYREVLPRKKRAKR